MKEIIPVTKNEIYKIKIIDLGTNGEGIGKINNFTVFVPNAVPKDIILVKILKVKKNLAYGKIEEFIKKSTDRINPVCKISNKCGGCQLQHIAYNCQLIYKRNKVKSAIEKIGRINNFIVNDVIGMKDPYYYRNKVQYPVGIKHEEIVVGFYANRSHNIIPVKKCYIQDSINEKIIDLCIQYMKQNNISPYNEENHTGLIRHIVTRKSYSTNEVNVTIVINGTKLPHQNDLIKRLTSLPNISGICININKNRTNVILGDRLKTIWGKSYITDKIGDIEFKISPLSFYQVNPIQTEKLYNKVLEFADLSGDEIIWDAYCGIGTITLFLAKQAKKVYGVEIVSDAIKDAKENAKINNIKNVEFFVGKAEDVITEQFKNNKIKPDVIVVDPPRKGCDKKLLDTMLQIKPKKIIYVSCDPATLARDLKELVGSEYNLEVVQPVDMFPQTYHVETVVLIKRKHS